MATSDEAVVATLQRLRTSPLLKPDITAIADTLCLSRPTIEARFKTVVGR